MMMANSLYQKHSVLLVFIILPVLIHSFQPGLTKKTTALKAHVKDQSASPIVSGQNDVRNTFETFASFLQTKQAEIIAEIENVDGSGELFTKDTWGFFEEESSAQTNGRKSGGITRVIQNGNVVEKGACSLTLIRDGKLTAERAKAIRGRQTDDVSISEGDVYHAAALSIVLHTRSPMVPTFRSDVRIFMVESESEGVVAWFGGGADLTPYFLCDEDIRFFHEKMKATCDVHNNSNDVEINYEEMKEECDRYFYLPARSEHRGTGGIFFDDLHATLASQEFVQAVADSWMPSWLPIVKKRKGMEYTEKQRQWQLLRRGRYLEFNLLYGKLPNHCAIAKQSMTYHFYFLLRRSRCQIWVSSG
jgi:coproporphyrinogen III oxidase